MCFYQCVSDNETLQDVLRAHRIKYLPVSWEDALCRFKAGISVKKYIKVTFVAVDQGGPLRDLLLCDIAIPYCVAVKHPVFQLTIC